MDQSYCSGQHENPNNLDCPNPKKAWLKEMQPKIALGDTEISLTALAQLFI